MSSGEGTSMWMESKHIYVGETRIVTTRNEEQNLDTAYQERNQFFYHSDHLGSAQLVTDYDGRTYERIEYTPYGESWIEWKDYSDNNYVTPFRFTSKERDMETGLYYYGARYLDAKTSRWLSTDPALGEYIPGAPISDEAKERNKNLPNGGVFNTTSLHLFNYANNNPIRYTDPDGQWPEIPSPINAFNFDFGRDYMIAAQKSFENGNNVTGAILVLDSYAEMAYDMVGAFFGAKAVGVAATAIGGIVAQGGFGDLSRAKEFGIQTYNSLKNAITGMGLQAHHIIEQRFAKLLGVDPGNMPSVALTKAEHQAFTNAWRNAISYGAEGTGRATVDQLRAAATEIYKNYPELLKAAEQLLGGK